MKPNIGIVVVTASASCFKELNFEKLMGLSLGEEYFSHHFLTVGLEIAPPIQPPFLPVCRINIGNTMLSVFHVDDDILTYKMAAL